MSCSQRQLAVETDLASGWVSRTISYRVSGGWAGGRAGMFKKSGHANTHTARTTNPTQTYASPPRPQNQCPSLNRHERQSAVSQARKTRTASRSTKHKLGVFPETVPQERCVELLTQWSLVNAHGHTVHWQRMGR